MPGELVATELGIVSRTRDPADVKDPLDPCALSRRMNSSIERVECPMVNTTGVPSSRVFTVYGFTINVPFMPT